MTWVWQKQTCEGSQGWAWGPLLHGVKLPWLMGVLSFSQSPFHCNTRNQGPCRSHSSLGCLILWKEIFFKYKDNNHAGRLQHLLQILWAVFVWKRNLCLGCSREWKLCWGPGLVTPCSWWDSSTAELCCDLVEIVEFMCSWLNQSSFVLQSSHNFLLVK